MEGARQVPGGWTQRVQEFQIESEVSTLAAGRSSPAAAVAQQKNKKQERRERGQYRALSLASHPDLRTDQVGKRACFPCVYVCPGPCFHRQTPEGLAAMCGDDGAWMGHGGTRAGDQTSPAGHQARCSSPTPLPALSSQSLSRHVCNRSSIPPQPQPAASPTPSPVPPSTAFPPHQRTRQSTSPSSVRSGE